MKNNDIKKLVIVGGGAAGWLAAAALTRQLSADQYEVTVVESSHIDAIGVGESVVQSVISFVCDLGVDKKDFFRKTQASHKLGIQFQDWHGEGETYFHQFGRLGYELNEHDFFQCWLKARSEGDSTPLRDFAPSAVMAKHKRFDLPGYFPQGSPLAGAEYSYHLDSSLMVKYLRDFAQQRQVKCINAHVVRVNKSDDGNIQSLELNNRQTVEGDFFIDCSGFRGLLIDEALESPFESWKHFLPCDRAVIIQTSRRGDILPYTVSTAMENGWTWRIPLQDRVSHGYVFSSEHCTDSQATRALQGSIKGKPLHEPRIIPLRVGMREQLWKKNCIALGLSGGFLEPLESTAIHLVTRGVQFMLDLFPRLPQDGQDWSSLAAEYNARMREDYVEIRDFIILHYCMTKRADSEFWRFCRSNSIPDSLARKIALFKARGELSTSENSLFKAASWQAVFTGMEVIPDSYHPFLDMIDFEAIHEAMKLERANIDKAAQALPKYNDFLKQ